MSIFPNAPYEIEFRCQFKSDEEAFQVLPFLKPSLKRTFTWIDNYYGPEVFQRGEVLRFSSVFHNGETRHFLGWKGVDRGTFANLRQELNESIPHNVIPHSAILSFFTGQDKAYKYEEIGPAFEQAGYHKFMSYEGQSIAGRYEPLGVNTKLMHCDVLRWPILVELEKLSPTESEAKQFEHDLQDICRQYKLDAYLVKEEPGTLIYEKIFGSEPDFLQKHNTPGI